MLGASDTLASRSVVCPVRQRSLNRSAPEGRRLLVPRSRLEPANAAAVDINSGPDGGLLITWENPVTETTLVRPFAGQVLLTPVPEAEGPNCSSVHLAAYARLAAAERLLAEERERQRDADQGSGDMTQPLSPTHCGPSPPNLRSDSGAGPTLNKGTMDSGTIAGRSVASSGHYWHRNNANYWGATSGWYAGPGVGFYTA